MASNREKLIASAQKYIEKGQLDKAVKEYLKIFAEEDADPRLWLKIGDLLVKQSKHREACEAYERVALYYAEEKEFRKAIAVYRQIVKLDPRLVEVYERLAKLYQAQGSVGDAIAQYEQIAAFYQSEGHSKEALAALQQIVDLDPENVASRIKLAEQYSKEKITDRAVAEFARAASQLRTQKRHDDFMKVAERQLFLAPDNVELARELAAMYLERGDARRALPKLQICFKHDQRHVGTLGLLAQAFESLGQVPKTVSVLKELARIHTENGNLREREETYRKILRLVPDDKSAMAVIGANQPPAPVVPPPEEPPVEDEAALVQHMQNRGRTGPLSQAMLAHVEEPTGTPTGKKGPSFLDDNGDDAGADPAAEREIARILTETEVYRKYGLHAKALEHLHGALVLAPQHFEVREKLASLLAAIGSDDEALHELWSLFKECEGSPQGERVLHRILEIRPGDSRAQRLLEDHQAHGGFDEEPSAQIAHSVDEQPRGPRPVEDEGDAVPIDLGDVMIEEDGFAADSFVGDTGSMAVPPNAVVPAESIVSADEMVFDEADFGSLRDAVAAPTPEPPKAQPRGRSAVLRSDEFDAIPTGSLDPGEHTSEIVGFELPDGLSFDSRAALGGDEPMVGRHDEPPPGFLPDALHGGVRTLEEGLDESDYFVQQGMFVEARRTLDALLAQFPKHPLILAKLGDLNVADRGAAPRGAEAPDFAPDEVAHLGDGADFGGDTDFSSPTNVTRSDKLEVDPEPSVESVIETTMGGNRRVVEKGVLPEDYDTHYDLGIAYKEMGLVDDAIAEFQIVMQDPAREVICHTMIGLCYLERGRITDAINQFKNGLYASQIQEREELALYYELGMAYERLSDAREALYYFEKVVKRNPRFRDVEQRIAALRGGAPVVDEPPAHSAGDVDAAFDDMIVPPDVAAK